MAIAQESEGAGVAPVAATRDVEFALDRFEHEDGRLVVEGRWYGVAGRRFVRPVLQIEGRRRIIAVLDHKPWRADEGTAWIAAFTHDGDAGPSRLQVAPDIAVEIPPPGPDAGDGTLRPARLARPPVEPTGGRFTREEPEAVVAAPVAPAPEPAEPPPVPAEPPAAAVVDVAPVAEPERDQGRADFARLEAERQEARAEADRARAEAERMLAEREAAIAERERYRSERDEAVGDLERIRAERDQAAGQAERFRTDADRARGEVESLEQLRERAAQLEADVERLQAVSDRALAERNAANDQLDRLRHQAGRQPYVAPRPLQESAPRRDWRVRVIAVVLIALLAYLLVTLLLAVV